MLWFKLLMQGRCVLSRKPCSILRCTCRGPAWRYLNVDLTRERLIRLQHENKMLKLEQGEAGKEKVVTLSNDLDLANSRINELETDHR